MKTLKQKLTVVGIIYAVDLLALVVFGTLGWL